MNDSRVALSFPMIGVPQTFVPPPPSTLLDGLIGGWDLDGNGDDVLGVSPALPIRTPDFVNGLSGQQALRTYGLDPSGEDYYEIPATSGLRPTTKISASMWIYFDGYPAGGVRVFTDYDQSTISTRWILGYSNGSNLYAVIYTPATSDRIVLIGSLLAMGLNTWHHIAVTWDSSIIRTYLDGVAVATSALSTPMNAGNPVHRICIGTQFNAGQGNNGRQQNCYLWNRDLTPDEIIELYNGGVVNRYPFVGAP